MTSTPYSPKIIVCESDGAAAAIVADLYADLLRDKPAAVLGLATGGTPTATYREFVRRYQQGDVSFARASSFNLDEYVGLSADHPQSFCYFMRQHLFDHVDLSADRANVPSGDAIDADAEARRYEEAIASSGGIDLQLLGIGHNGHIAFNEPGSARNSRTRVVDLTDETIRNNARFFDSIDQVPTTAITMGVGTILEARRIVLLATGADKSEAVAAAAEGSVSEAVPASLLRHHSEVTFVLDRAAASGLRSATG
ncbi:MAG: glucosamine-6-phosphate deaminase [Planctomycetota bacterium]